MLYRLASNKLSKIFKSTLKIEIGLSDFLKLIVIVLKFKHEKLFLKLYNAETTTIFTRQDLLSNFNRGLLTWI